MQPVWPSTEVLDEEHKRLKEALAWGEADQIEVTFAAVAPWPRPSAARSGPP
jgi:hypothetical protein